MEQRIVCAAIRDHRGRMVCSARHFDGLMHEQLRLVAYPLPKPSTWEQGFIDQHGKFLNRQEAWDVAVKADQIIRPIAGCEGILYSENLY